MSIKVIVFHYLTKVDGHLSRVDRDKCPEHFHYCQQKGLLIQPIVKEGYRDLVPAMLQKAGAWFSNRGENP